MNNINLLILLFFVMGIATGMIVAGLYNVYEFNKANKELIEMKTSCECKKEFGDDPYKFPINLSINLS